ncbi:MAG: ArnT family glycosyltransferase [Chthoniobacteraceae bacterium]
MSQLSEIRRSTLRDVLILLLLSYFAFWWNLGKMGLIDPDEPFYALTAREMVQSGDWMTPQIFGAPQFEKPILYYWTVAASFRAFGESEWAGRFSAALAATALVFLTYAFARRLFNARAGLIAGAFMAGGVELCLMGRLMLTDIPLALFITAALYCYWRALEEPARRDRWVILHFVCTGLAVLTKGPIGTLVPLFAALSFTWLGKRPWVFRGRGFWIGAGLHLLIVGPWYGLMLEQHCLRFIEEFFYRDNILRFVQAEHPSNNHFWYYPGVLLIGSIPWLPAALLGLKKLCWKFRASPATLFCACWFLPNLLFVTLAQSKLPSYGFYLFVPLAVAIGAALDAVVARGFESAAERRVVLGAAALQAVVPFAVPFVPLARGFSVGAVSFGLVLSVALVAFCLRRYRLWIAATACATAVLLVGLVSYSFEPLDETLSIRATALKMASQRHDGEPLLSGKFAMRGVAYYTHDSVSVLSQKASPFWAEHPVPILHLEDLPRLMEKYPSALCTMRQSEWRGFSSSEVFGASGGERIGENILVRATRPANPASMASDHPQPKGKSL